MTGAPVLATSRVMKITHSDQVEFVQTPTRGKFGQRRKPLGGQKLQAGLWELEPGKTSFPLHSHAVTEEALYVLSGRAKVRTPEGLQPIGPGDFVSFPPGGPAHQLINDGTEVFRYLAMSAGQGFDIVEYPDSGKVAASIGAYPTGQRMMFMKNAQVADYFAGEKDAE